MGPRKLVRKAPAETRAKLWAWLRARGLRGATTAEMGEFLGTCGKTASKHVVALGREGRVVPTGRKRWSTEGVGKRAVWIAVDPPATPPGEAA